MRQTLNSKLTRSEGGNRSRYGWRCTEKWRMNENWHNRSRAFTFANSDYAKNKSWRCRWVYQIYFWAENKYFTPLFAQRQPMLVSYQWHFGRNDEFSRLFFSVKKTVTANASLCYTFLRKHFFYQQSSSEPRISQFMQLKAKVFHSSTLDILFTLMSLAMSRLWNSQTLITGWHVDTQCNAMSLSRCVVNQRKTLIRASCRRARSTY